MARELEVWLFAERIGTLALIEDRLNFRYSPDWLSRPDATTLSSSLHLQAESFDDHHTRPFFGDFCQRATPAPHCTAISGVEPE